ncbi:MAG: hypothetical protein Q9174_002760 [Haloplaca sp. 1 TL-2023]
MPFRAKVKKAFGKSNDDHSETSSDPSTFKKQQKTGAGYPENIYKPGEIPESKYRGPYDKKHQQSLHAFSFSNAFQGRRRSSQSLYSPMGSRLPSRMSSFISRKSFVRSRQQSRVSDTLMENTDGDDAVGNVGLSRQHTKEEASRSQTRGGHTLDLDNNSGPQENQTTFGIRHDIDEDRIRADGFARPNPNDNDGMEGVEQTNIGAHHDTCNRHGYSFGQPFSADDLVHAMTNSTLRTSTVQATIIDRLESNPGKSKDDEVMYGSGESSDPVHMNTGAQAGNTTATNDPADPAGNTARDPVGQGGLGSIQQGSNPTSSSQMPGAFDNDTTSATSIKSGVPGNSDETRTTYPSAARETVDTNKSLPNEPATGVYGSSNTSGAGPSAIRSTADTNKSLPDEPATGAYGSSNTTGTGPHSSGLASKLDPRADSDRDGSKGLGSQGMTGDTAGTTAGNMGNRTTASTTSSGLPTSGVANMADPRMDSDRDGSRGLGTTAGYGAGTGATVGSTHQGDLSRSGPGASTGTATGAPTGAATGEPLPKGYGPESWSHDHLKHGHDYAGDPCENEPPAPGAPHFASGPHSLDTANRLDPHVGGGGFGAPSSTVGNSQPETGHHHPGRDAGVGAGLAAAGAGAYGASQDSPSSSTTHQGTTSAGPHNSNLANKADPRVDSDLDGKRGLGPSTGTSGTTGGFGSSTGTGSGLDSSRTAPGHQSSNVTSRLDPRVEQNSSQQIGTGLTSGMPATDTSRSTEPSTGQQNHPSRDAFLAGTGGAAAGGAALHEGQKHHGQHAPTDVTSSTGYSNPYPPSSTGGGVGSGPTSSTAAPVGTAGSYGTPAGASTGTSAGPHSSNIANKADPRVDSDLDGKRGIGSSETSTGNEHHYGRDAGLVGVGAGAGAGAAYAADKRHEGSHPDTSASRSMQPTTTQQPLSGTSVPGSGPASSSTPRYDDGDRTREDHSGRNAALGAGAGAGVGAAGYAAGDQLSKKDLEREREAAHQQELKDQKAAHKQEVKEEKHHQHELEKEKKAHDKAMAKEEAKHQKEESKHHKDEPKEEKKHHGLFSFLHRDKSDKEPKDDDATRKEGEGDSHTPAVGTTAGTGAGLSEKEKHEQAKEHDRNRLHKDPPPGYIEKKQAEAPEEGATTLGNKTDPTFAGREDTVDLDNTRDPKGGRIEPVTGLPVDTSKGEGAGGTDSTPVPSNTYGQSAGTSGTAAGAGNQEGFGHLMDHKR